MAEMSSRNRDKQRNRDSGDDLSPPRNSKKRHSSRSPINRQRSSPRKERRTDLHRREHTRHDRHSRYHSPRRRRSSDGDARPMDERSRPAHSDGHRDHRRRSVEPRDQRRGRGNGEPSGFNESHKFGRSDDHGAAQSDREKQDEGPNFKTSGKLAAETNTYKGVVIIYSEPPEARVPKTRWRLYPFKGEEHLHVLYVHRQSAYLIGRDRKVVDMPIDHPSCSKQHAALQYRLVQVESEEGKNIKVVKPYIIDLNSTNGTYLNNQRIDPRRYYELKEQDVIKFGFSSREYVLLTETSADSPSPEENEPLK